MDTKRIIDELEAERNRLETAIAALQGSGQHRRKKAGRRSRPPLSPAARKRISDAQKKRWAAQRKAARG